MKKNGDSMEKLAGGQVRGQVEPSIGMTPLPDGELGGNLRRLAGQSTLEPEGQMGMLDYERMDLRNEFILIDVAYLWFSFCPDQRGLLPDD